MGRRRQELLSSRNLDYNISRGQTHSGCSINVCSFPFLQLDPPLPSGVFYFFYSRLHFLSSTMLVLDYVLGNEHGNRHKVTYLHAYEHWRTGMSKIKVY